LAVLAHAALAMGRTLCPDRERVTLAAAVMVGTFVWPSTMGMLGLLGVAAAWGWFGMTRGAREDVLGRIDLPVGAGLGMVGVFGVFLLGVPWLAGTAQGLLLDLFNAFSRAGILVFGGGHVVLPLLSAEVVDKGWVAADTFLAGYGLVQGMPGPMFSFAAFLGAATAGLPGALVATVAIFLPGALLLAAILPWWERLRQEPRAQGLIAAVGAASVGLLLHVLFDPGWRLAIGQGSDYCLLAAALVLLGPWRQAPWLVAMLCATSGWLLSLHP
jgi:chromate transporter